MGPEITGGIEENYNCTAAIIMDAAVAGPVPGRCVARGENMTDLRTKVEDDRGMIKKIQMHLPGYRGYRTREDLRIADSLLRNEISKRLEHVEEDAEVIRSKLAKKMELEKMESFKGLIGDIQTYKNRIRHATQEYSGISADHRIEERELSRMYEYDLQLFDHVQDIEDYLHELPLQGAPPDFERKVDLVRTEVKKMLQAFDMRMETIAGIEVGK
jgi:hypothetical protein